MRCKVCILNSEVRVCSLFPLIWVRSVIVLGYLKMIFPGYSKYIENEMIYFEVVKYQYSDTNESIHPNHFSDGLTNFHNTEHMYRYRVCSCNRKTHFASIAGMRNADAP